MSPYSAARNNEKTYKPTILDVLLHVTQRKKMINYKISR